MNTFEPTSQDLETRLAEAEGIIAALRSGEVDAILLENTIALLRVKDVEDELLQTQRKLERRMLEHSAALVEVNCRLQQEIAKRAQAEEALRKSAECLRIVLKHSGLIVDQTDLQSISPRVHQPQPEIDSTDRIGPRDDELADYEGTRTLLQTKQQVMTTGIGAHTEIAVPVPNGVRHYDLLIEPRHNAAGQIIGAITSTDDITDRKRTEAELQRATAAADAANRVKSQFIAHLSHALLTSLNALLRDAQLSGQPPNVTATPPQRLDIMHRTAEHLLGMLNDLLDFSTRDACPIAATGRPFNVRHVLDAMIESLRLPAETKGLTLMCSYAPDVPAVVSGDDLHLQCILLNLLRNAIAFTENGYVTLRVHGSGVSDFPPPHPLQKGNARASALTTSLRFVVEDTGVGIPAEQLEAISAPFYQFAADSSKTQGAGLGLSISRMLARLMHSEICVWSQVGQGSAFWFDLTLPVVETDHATALPPEIAQPLSEKSSSP